MLEVLKNIGGFFRPLLQRAVEVGWSLEDVQREVAETGLFYPPERLAGDFEDQIIQKTITDEIATYAPNYLIPVTDHLETVLPLKSRYEYVVDVTYLTEEHELMETQRVVGSGTRLSRGEVLAAAEELAEKYPERGGVEWFVGNVVGSWKRRGA